MANEVNSHVTRMHRYLPFSPAHEQIYEEYQVTKDALNLETVALKYLMNALEESPVLVLLTGDAGHGKTHLCRRMLEEYLHVSEDEARSLLNSKCDGAETIATEPTHKDLRVFKDFSEMLVEEAAQRINTALNSNDTTTIICANEGRLRAILEHPSAGPEGKNLLIQFRNSFSDGQASLDGSIHIINLNFQSIATDDGDSLVYRTFKSWLSGNRWRSCNECDCNKDCPIYFNRNQLYGKGSESRVRNIERLFWSRPSKRVQYLLL